MVAHRYWKTSLWTLLVGHLVQHTAGDQFDSSISKCPARCSIHDQSAWTYYYDLQDLDGCDGTTIFQLNINNRIGDPQTDVYYRACTAAGGSVRASSAVDARILKRQQLSFNATKPLSHGVTLSTTGGTASADPADVEAAITALRTYMVEAEEATTMVFSQSGQVVAGLYAGAQVSRSSGVSVLEQLSNTLSSGVASQRVIAQACGASNETNRLQFLGVAVDANKDVAAVQDALRDWNNATCLETLTTVAWPQIAIEINAGTEISVAATHREGVSGSFESQSASQRRQSGTCLFTQVQAGDGCWSLAQRCGISTSDLEGHNRAGLCDTLKPAEYVCCSSGSLPDFSPQPGSDGMCVAYTVGSGDTCFDLAEANQMTVADIEARNTQTWGWTGCGNLLLGAKICLSTGDPPFPAEVSNAVCGPQAPGTAEKSPPRDPQAWADLNPCPLKACCNIWGQCGVTTEFCTVAPSETGNPGTAAPGSNGCMTNCGTGIITGPAPSSFEHVGYYESYHVDRPCNFMSISDIPEAYTIVHWAFGDISDDFTASISPYEADWADFKASTGFKKIISFGGWAFSTEHSSYYIFRQGVEAGNRQRFAENVVDFVVSEGLDGVDFDWEYPGAPDDQGSGIPIDLPEKAREYLEFLKLVRAGLPGHLTIGIAAPASFWYLKAFPMEEIAVVVDYVVYMTYDLHGQWDFGNTFTSPGCPNGDCLRTHINQTETETALSMVTKAGVPANKIYLGQALYGRSFKMAQAGCWQENCKFTGPSSGARPGRCTGVGGYLSNLEIREIIESGQHSAQEYHSEEAGDILVYDETEWVSWAKPSTYNSRTDWARSLGLGGISDWAIDLDVVGDRAGGGGGGGDGGGNGTGEVVLIDPSLYQDATPTAYCQPPCTFVFPPWVLPYTTTITPEPITSTVFNQYIDLVTRWGTDGATTAETRTVSTTTVTVITIAPVTTTALNVWNYIWTDTDQTVATLTSSIQFPPITLTQQSTVYTTSGETTTLEGMVYTFLPGPYPPLVTEPTSAQTTTLGPPTGTTSPGQTTQPPPPTGCENCPPEITMSRGEPGPICDNDDDDCGEPCEYGCVPPVPCFPPGLFCNCIGPLCDSGSCFGLGCTDFPGGRPPPGGFPPPPGPPPPTPPPGNPTDSEPSRTSSTTSSTTSSDSCPFLMNEDDFGPIVDENGDQVPGEPGDSPEDGTGSGTTAPPGGGVTPPPSSTTSYISCRTQNQQPGQGITQAHCICSGSTFPQSTATDPPNSCAYTTLPGSTATISISTLPTGPTSTRTSDPEPSPEPEPEPEPSPNVLVVWANELLVVNRNSYLLTWSWEGVSVAAEDESSADYCNKRENPEVVRKGNGRTQPPRYPSQLGPFNLEGHEDCEYTGSDDTVGEVRCGDGYVTSCQGYGEPIPVYDCRQDGGSIARDNYFFSLACPYG